MDRKYFRDLNALGPRVHAPCSVGQGPGSPVQPHLGTSGHRGADRSQENQNLQGGNWTGRSPKKWIPPSQKSNAQEGSCGSRGQVLCWVPPSSRPAQLAHTRVNLHRVLRRFLLTGPFEQGLKEEGVKKGCSPEWGNASESRHLQVLSGPTPGSQTCYA